MSSGGTGPKGPTVIPKAPAGMRGGFSFLVQMSSMQCLSEFDIADLAELFSQGGFKKTHAARLLRAYYDGDGEVDFGALRLGKQLQSRIESEFQFHQSRPITSVTSGDGTTKFLLSFKS